nr:hypothetical protein [Tanacetum cinerariifolium]
MVPMVVKHNGLVHVKPEELDASCIEASSFKLPYHLIFAVATLNFLYVYGTEGVESIAVLAYYSNSFPTRVNLVDHDVNVDIVFRPMGGEGSKDRDHLFTCQLVVPV